MKKPSTAIPAISKTAAILSSLAILGPTFVIFSPSAAKPFPVACVALLNIFEAPAPTFATLPVEAGAVAADLNAAPPLFFTDCPKENTDLPHLPVVLAAATRPASKYANPFLDSSALLFIFTPACSISPVTISKASIKPNALLARPPKPALALAAVLRDFALCLPLFSLDLASLSDA